MASRTNSKRVPKDAGRKTSRKPCQFCKDKTEWIDYKDVNLLRKFVSDRGKIRARRVTGNCSQHQRDIAVAVKTTRELGLLPYTQRTSTERAGRPPRSDRRSEGTSDEATIETEDVETEEATEGSDERVEA